MNGECRIIVYKNCKIQPNKNFKVDNLSSYLATLEVANRVVNRVVMPYVSQWMKHALKHTYKMTLTQSYHTYQDQDITSVFANDLDYNYLEAVNYDKPINSDTKVATSKVYYFIKEKRWKSADCVELDLEMDVINSLIDNGTGLELTDKTMILRQHKDRWKNGTSPRQFKPIIDLYSEGINPVLFKKKEDTLFADIGEPDENNYYLVYKASQTGDNQPLDVFLCSDSTFEVDMGSSGWNGYFNAKELGRKYGVIIYGADTFNTDTNVGCKVSFIDKNGNDRTFTIASSSEAILIYKLPILNSFRIMIGSVSSSGFSTTSFYDTGAIAYNRAHIYISGLFKMRVGDRDTIYGDFDMPSFATNTSITPTYISGLGVASEYTPPTNQYTEVGTIEDIDRTDPTLVKIVKLPYCPISIHLEDDYAYLPSGWEVSDFGSGLKMIHSRTSNSIECLDSEYFLLMNANNDLESPYYDLRQRGITEAVNLVPKSADFETKLLNSEFYLKKFVYDSFAYDFRLELYNVIDYAQSFSIKQITSLAISSNFAFKFFESEFTDDEEQNGRSIDVDNYSNLLFVSRNNEVVLYNSNYLNYIRSGYNFDIKTRNRQLSSSIVLGTITTIGAVAGGVLGGPIGVASAIGMGASAISQFTRTIYNTAQSDQNIAEKLRSAELQGVSVAGADSLDIMSAYTNGNKAKLVKYEVSPKMKKAVFDLLYYTGYVAGFQGLPDTTSRMWFNFVQAQPVFTNMQNFPNDWVEALFNKYNEGITFLHRQGWENAYLWDFEQANENWETSLRKQRVQTATATSVVKNREYILDPSAEMDFTARIMISGKCTFRIRQKSNMMAVKEITGCDGVAVRFAFSETIQVIKNLAVIEELDIEDYNQDNFYWSFEFSEAIATPTSQQQQLLDYCLGYVID